MSFDIGARHDAMRIAELPPVIHPLIIAYAGNEIINKYTICISEDAVVASVEPLVTFCKGILYINNVPKPLGIGYVNAAYIIRDTLYVIRESTYFWIYDISAQSGYILNDVDKIVVFQQTVYYKSTYGTVYKHIARDNNVKVLDNVYEFDRRGSYLLLKWNSSRVIHLWDGERLHTAPANTFAVHNYENMTLRISKTKIEGFEWMFASKPIATHQKKHFVLIQTEQTAYIWDFIRKQMYTLDPLPTIYEWDNVTHHREKTQIVVYE